MILKITIGIVLAVMALLLIKYLFIFVVYMIAIHRQIHKERENERGAYESLMQRKRELEGGRRNNKGKGTERWTDKRALTEREYTETTI